MDIYMIILRLIHIFAGIFWVGTALFVTIVAVPAMQNMRSGIIMQSLIRYARFNLIVMTAAALTVVAGLLLYMRVSNGFSADWMNTSKGIVLSIGSLAGILAFAHAGTTLAPANKRTREILMQVEGEPTEEQRTILMGLAAKVGRHSRITVILMIIAVAGMASARYF